MPPFLTDSSVYDNNYIPSIKLNNRCTYENKGKNLNDSQGENENSYSRNKFKLSSPLRVSAENRDKWLVNLSGELIPEDILDIACLGEKFGVPIMRKERMPIYKLIAALESKMDLIAEQDRSTIRTICSSVITDFTRSNAKIRYTDPELIRKIQAARTFKISNPHIMFLKADKGNVTVIVHRDFYLNKMANLLNDTTTYKIMKEDCTPLIEKQINKLTVHWYKQNFITEHEKSKLSSRNGNIARSYGLPKIHKKDVPFRMIVSFIGTPTYQVAKYLQRILSDCVKEEMKHWIGNRTVIMNSTSLVRKIRKLKLPQDFTMISMDVVSLFTNVPLHLVIFGIKKRWKFIEKYTKIKKNEFIKAISLAFNASAFQFNGAMYQQVFGAAMGSPLSPILAEIVLQDLEEYCFRKLDFPVYFYTRYVDDVLVFLPKSRIMSMLSCFNSYHERLQFTLEREKNNRINFLEVSLIKKEGKISIDWYRKPTFSGRYLNYNSYHPQSNKISTIYNLTDRAILLSDTRFHLKNLAFIRWNLIANGYPRRLVTTIINKRQKYLEFFKDDHYSTSKSKRTEDVTYMTLPYVENLSEKLQYYLRKFRICLSFKNDSNLGWLFAGSRDKFPIYRKVNTIHKIPCLLCTFVFIGHTKRQLGRKINQYYQSIHQPHVFHNSNELTEHAANFKHNFDFTRIQILAVEANYKKRQLLCWIFKEKESLSRTEESVQQINVEKIYSYLTKN